MKKTTILLDAGGVLLNEENSENIAAHLIVKLLKAEIGSYTKEDYWRDIKESIERFCPRTTFYVLWKNVEPNTSRFDKLLADYRRLIAADKPSLKLYDSIKTEIPKLGGKFSLVLAGQYGRDVYDLLETNGLSRYFANRLSQEDFDITKPDPRYLAQIAKRSGVMCEECVMVGDRIDNDIIPAKQNNMGTVFARTGIYKSQRPRIPEEAPDIILDGLNGLADKIIEKWS